MKNINIQMHYLLKAVGPISHHVITARRIYHDKMKATKTEKPAKANATRNTALILTIPIPENTVSKMLRAQLRSSTSNLIGAKGWYLHPRSPRSPINLLIIATSSNMTFHN
uniref:Uncharacterized protein n=1 Tax=Spongospora subterranea TaxID=70186 RepID=A0A0H5QQH0_9EUKA|eukprot:CRZ04320.1 hypothetical protein [Spongospora subterranea]